MQGTIVLHPLRFTFYVSRLKVAGIGEAGGVGYAALGVATADGVELGLILALELGEVIIAGG